MFIAILLIFEVADVFCAFDAISFAQKYCKESSETTTCSDFKLTEDDKLQRITTKVELILENCEFGELDADAVSKLGDRIEKLEFKNCKVSLTSKQENPTGESKLTSLSIENGQFKDKDVNTNVFKQFHTLYTLKLENNQLTTIGNIAPLFRNMTDLFILILSRNKLTSIPENFSEECSDLNILQLDNNQLTILPNNSLKKFSKVLTLTLQDNKLKTLGSGLFSGMINLKLLYLQNNQLEEISADTFSTIRNLEVLNMSRNKLAKVPKTLFQGLRKLRFLDLSWNQLKDIDLYGLEQIDELKLNNNLLKSIQSLAPFRKLRKLYLQDNQLKMVYRLLDLPASLSTIDISNNYRIQFEDDSYVKLFKSSGFKMENTRFEKFGDHCFAKGSSDRITCNAVQVLVEWKV